MAGMDSWREKDTIPTAEEVASFSKVTGSTVTYRTVNRRREDEMMQEMGMKSPEPTAPSVTQQNMSYLEEAIDTLFRRVELLGVRLENVLTEGSPEAAADRRSFGGNSPHSEQLAIFCRRLYDLVDRVEYLTARIDL